MEWKIIINYYNNLVFPSLLKIDVNVYLHDREGRKKLVIGETTH